MAVKCVEAFAKDGKVCVIVEGGNPEEVSTADAKKLAIEYSGKCGYAHVGFNGTSGAYPIDAEGNTPEQAEDWNKMAKENKIVGYRNDIFLLPRL